MPMLSNTIDHLAQALLLTCILNELTFVSAHFVSCQKWSYLKWACFRNVLLPALFLDGGFIFHWSPWAFDPLDPVDTPLNIQLFLSSGFCARMCMVRSAKEKKCLKLDIPQTDSCRGKFCLKSTLCQMETCQLSMLLRFSCKEITGSCSETGKIFVIFFLIWNIKCQQCPAYTILIQFMVQHCNLYHPLPSELPEQWFFIMCATFRNMKVSPNT